MPRQSIFLLLDYYFLWWWSRTPLPSHTFTPFLQWLFCLLFVLLFSFPVPSFTLQPDLYLDFLVFGAATTFPAANICKWFRGKRQYGKTSKLKKSRTVLQYQRWTEGRLGKSVPNFGKGSSASLANGYSQLNILCCSSVRWGLAYGTPQFGVYCGLTSITCQVLGRLDLSCSTFKEIMLL